MIFRTVLDPQGYPNQGGPPNQPPMMTNSNQLRPAPMMPNQFGPPPTMPNPQFPPMTQQPQVSQPFQPNAYAPSGPGAPGQGYPPAGPPTGIPPQAQTQQRIDPDMVPNVVQVLEQSQEKSQEAFITNAPGLLPPLVGLDFACQDQGSCNPRFIRSTTYTIPHGNDMIKQSHIPLALAISPLANVRPDEVKQRKRISQ